MPPAFPRKLSLLRLPVSFETSIDDGELHRQSCSHWFSGLSGEHDSLPQQPKSGQLETLKLFKTMLERLIAVLHISKRSIWPGLKDVSVSYEKQIVNFVNINRPRKQVPPLQQGQLPPPHMHSIQQSQSQIPKLWCLTKEYSMYTDVAEADRSLILEHFRQATMRWNPEVRAQSAVDSESVKDERKSHMIVATDACLLLLASGESPIAARVLRNYELPTKKLHQMKDVNDLKMKQGMGVKPWVIRQHMSSCQCYHFHQQLNILQSPIQPLRLLVPTNYPNCYPILLDKLPVELDACLPLLASGESAIAARVLINYELPAKKEAAEHRIDRDGFIGKWHIVVVKDLPFSDQRLNGKIPRMLPHYFFAHPKYSIWVDSKSQYRRDSLGVLEVLLWRSNSVLVISEHGARSSIYDEVKAIVKKKWAKSEEVEVQLTQYQYDGMPEDKRFNGKKALSEASVIVREHTPLTNMFMCLWFNEVVQFTSRDQLSFPYVLWRLKVLENVNVFPVCTRKDLVNSMGHIRKAKPLGS